MVQVKENIGRGNTQHYELKNVSEELVDMFLMQTMNSADMCTCDRCQADVKAYALNIVPQHYVVSELGEAMARASILSTQVQADIVTAIAQGAVIVGANPRHED